MNSSQVGETDLELRNSCLIVQNPILILCLFDQPGGCVTERDSDSRLHHDCDRPGLARHPQLHPGSPQLCSPKQRLPEAASGL